VPGGDVHQGGRGNRRHSPMTCPAWNSATTATGAASTPSSPSHHLTDPALHKLALIVRGADCGAPHWRRRLHGLLAISKGLSLNFEDDHEMLKHGMVHL
jgi:hypothetical protein